jgi:transposase
MSPTDPDSRIAKMKDGRTHLAYKAEHVIDLETELVLAVPIYHADAGDADTLVDSVMEAQLNLTDAGLDVEIEEVAADIRCASALGDRATRRCGNFARRWRFGGVGRF